MRADRGQLEQVITNLALNARDAMPSGGSVELAVRRIDGEVELTVADSGVGMDAETIEHAFEPFFTTKGPGKGTGLGLATVYGIVTQTGGEISIDSRPGEGSTFRVVLPLSPDPAAVPVVREERAVAPTGTEGVLVAEDEQTIRRLVAEVLERSGYKVFAAANGDEALRLLEQHVRRDRPAAHRRRHARDERPRPRPRGVDGQALATSSLHLRLHERAGRGVRRSGRRVHRQAVLAPGARRQGARRARRGLALDAAARGHGRHGPSERLLGVAGGG